MAEARLRLRAEPPSTWSLVFMGFILVLILNDHSMGLEPAQYIPPSFQVQFVVPVLEFALGIDYLIRLLSAAAVWSSRRSLPIRQRRRRWRWAVLPASAVALVSAAVTDWPRQVRFALSRSAFESIAAEYDAGILPNPGPRWVGLYQIREIGRTMVFDCNSHVKGLGFATADGVCGRKLGFVYAPNDPVGEATIGSPYLAPRWFQAEWRW